MAMLLTKNKTNGFFIECGAFDGETMSVTLPLEHKLNWSGLLIEAEPNYFDVTLKTRRNTTFVPACLSLTTKPKLSAFNVGKKMQGKIVDGVNVPGTVNVQCLPIYSILLAVNRTTVDAFSLDIEGNELDVLQTIPFDKVDIKIFIVEHFNMRQGKQALHDFMIDKGYVSIPSLPDERKRGWAVWDYIFVKKGSGYKETRD